MSHVKIWWLLRFAVLAGAFVTGGTGLVRARPSRPAAPAPGKPVEMFEAVKTGQIEVKFIPKDSTQGRILITNKTDKPLSVELPKAAGAVQILAQMGGMGGMGGGMGGRGMGMQSMGMGGGGMRGGMGGGMGGGMFNVEPEKVAEVKVPCVCLEHGKAEPRPTGTFELRPIESVTTKTGVRELCGMLGQMPQHVAQAAAWHLNNDMSWQQLAAKRVKRLDGSSYPYFDPREINMAMVAANQAVAAAKTPPKTQVPTSPGQTAQTR